MIKLRYDKPAVIINHVELQQAIVEESSPWDGPGGPGPEGPGGGGPTNPAKQGNSWDIWDDEEDDNTGNVRGSGYFFDD